MVHIMRCTQYTGTNNLCSDHHVSGIQFGVLHRYLMNHHLRFFFFFGVINGWSRKEWLGVPILPDLFRGSVIDDLVRVLRRTVAKVERDRVLLRQCLCPAPALRPLPGESR